MTSWILLLFIANSQNHLIFYPSLCESV